MTDLDEIVDFLFNLTMEEEGLDYEDMLKEVKSQYPNIDQETIDKGFEQLGYEKRIIEPEVNVSVTTLSTEESDNKSIVDEYTGFSKKNLVIDYDKIVEEKEKEILDKDKEVFDALAEGSDRTVPGDEVERIMNALAGLVTDSHFWEKDALSGITSDVIRDIFSLMKNIHVTIQTKTEVLETRYGKEIWEHAIATVYDPLNRRSMARSAKNPYLKLNWDAIQDEAIPIYDRHAHQKAQTRAIRNAFRWFFPRKLIYRIKKIAKERGIIK